MGFCGFGVVGMLFVGTMRPRKQALAVLALMFVISASLLLSSCAGGTGIVRNNGGTTPGTYSVMVSGTSGTLKHSATLTLVVQ